MAKQIISEEFKRMQVLAGLITENENKIKTILSKIGDIEEKIYDQYSDDEIEAKFDYSKAIDDIKSKYKNDENKMYDALVSHLKKLKSTFPVK